MLQERCGPQTATVRIGEREFVNFSANDYLGLADETRLSDAVRQTRLVCLAEDSTVTKPTATVLARSQPWIKVAATLAAVSAVALVCVVFARLNSSPTSPTATDDSESPALAVVWSERALSDDNEAADEDSSLAEWPQDVELPGEESWILTAVFEMQPEMPDGAPGPKS